MLKGFAAATVALLVATKFCDCLSTLCSIRVPAQETNPLARRLMEAVGVRRAVWLIFSAAAFMSVLTGVVYILQGRSWQALYVALGLPISLVQMAVALRNWSGRHNLITETAARGHKRAERILRLWHEKPHHGAMIKNREG